MPELVHLHDIQPRGPALARWERIRHRQARWFVECLAEAVSIYGLHALYAVDILPILIDRNIHLLVCWWCRPEHLHLDEPSCHPWCAMSVLLNHTSRM